MKKSFYFLMVAITGIAFTSCMTPQGRPDYTASGALAGGATGAIIGGMAEHPGVGALAGAVLGGIIGHGMDQAQESQLRAQAPQTMERIEEGEPLTIADVEALTKAGISDDLIISQIRNSRTVYYLTAQDIIALKNHGVSDRVINFMINTQSQVGSHQVSGVEGPPPPAPLPEPLVVAPGPDYFWVGGAWVWSNHRWNWHHGYWYKPRHYHRHGYRR